jgi:N-acetylglucosamine-6-sulfatase
MEVGRTRLFAALAVALVLVLAAHHRPIADEVGPDFTVARGQPLGKRANIVLILTDDQSYESVAKMPFVSSRTDWYTFTNAFINNATCCPSRATILTGLWSHHHGVEATAGSPRFNDRSTVATWLHRAGYRTALVGKYHLGHVNEKKIQNYIPPGWDEWYGWHGIRGREAYYDYTLNENGTLVKYGSTPQDYSTDVLANKAIDFVHRSKPGEPFFLYFAPRAPHNPWIAAPRHVGAFPRETYPKSPNYNEADMSDKPAWWRTQPLQNPGNDDEARRKQYDTLLAVDDAVRAIVRALDQKRLMTDTVIIFMTDNGYAFGEHRREGKLCAYEECNKTPFLVWYPKGKARIIPELVSNADVAPTLAALAGIDPGAPVDGRSILPLLDGDTAGWREAVLLRAYHRHDEDRPVPTFWGIRTSKYKYIETVGTREVELYDLVRDPYELQSVAGDPAHADICKQLAAKLLELRTARPRNPQRLTPPAPEE